MKIPRIFQIGLLLHELLVAISIQSTIATGPHRGVRGVTTRRRHRNRTLQKDGAMGYETKDEQPSPSPTPEPTVEQTEEYYDDYGKEPKKGQEKDLEVVPAEEKDNVDDKDISTDSPTDSSSMELTLEPTVEPTGRPTTLAPTAEPTSEPTREPTPDAVEEAKEAATPEPAAEETPEPILLAATEELQVVETESPTQAPTEPPKQNGKQKDNVETEPTDDEPAVEAVEAATQETQETQAPSAPTSSIENTITTTAPTESLAYSVRLDPLYMTVEMKGDFHEVGFMEVLIGYMETNMARDFKQFQSISYGISTFSQITQDPSVVGRAQHNFTDEEPKSPSPSLVSNVTVHVHLLTATFTEKPTVSDVMIEEYMAMLLENPELLQEYVDSQPNLDATIYSVSVEFESVIPPTYVQQDGNVAEAQTDVGEDSSEKEGRSVGFIAGVTVGCFAAVLWMVFLYGIQSRAAQKG